MGDVSSGIMSGGATRSAAKCEFCNETAESGDGSLGEMLGPIGHSNSTGEPIFVHRQCALWSPEVQLDALDRFEDGSSMTA